LDEKEINRRMEKLHQDIDGLKAARKKLQEER